MRLDRVTLYHISMSLVQPFETSFGTETEREAIIVRVESDGAVGWGESVASSGPWYSYETVKTAWHVLEDYLVPIVLEETFDSPHVVFDRLARVRGHRMAKAGLEMALWDLEAVRQGIPLSRLLGGTRDRVQVGVSVGIQPTPERLLEQVNDYLEQGYRRIKIKIKPGWDAEVVQRLRDMFPDLALQVDANSAYHLSDAQIFRALDTLDLLLIEQPLSHDDIYFHSKLQAQLQTPICLDESIHTVEHARAALELGSCRNINIKPGRVGGYTPSIGIHNLCREQEIPVWHGGMLETGIGRAHSVALASLPGFVLPGDISASSRYYREDLVDPPFTLNTEDSTLSVPSGAGIGVTVLEQRLNQQTHRRLDLTP